MEIRDILKLWAENVKDEIGNKIVDTRTVDTGSLLKSVNYKIIENKVRFSMLDYGKYTDEGKPKGQNWIKDPRKVRAPRNFFNKVIRDNENELEKLLDESITDDIEKVFDLAAKDFTRKRTGRTIKVK